MVGRYVSMIILWAGVGSRDYLKMRTKYGPIGGQTESLLYPSVTAAQVGIILSSLGQALQCLVVAPRLLASIAADGMIRPLRPFAKLSAGGEPKRALAFTYFFGGLMVLLGSLNLVAPLLSMCFLMCYAFMNLTCFILDALKDPHWRPKWKCSPPSRTRPPASQLLARRAGPGQARSAP